MEDSWLNGSYIESEIDFDETLEKDELVFAWFSAKSSLQETELEVAEKKAARQRQITSGVLRQNGQPAGYTPPKRPENKFERKRRRELERQAIKQQRKQRRR
jgi:hypothetical protein